MRQVVYWGLYDLANTIFSALFVTFYFPLYIKNYLGGSEFMIGLVFGLSLLTVGVLVPFIGAWSDKVGVRMPFIAVFTVLCCLATLAVPFSGLSLALFLGFVANFCYHAALTVYNALLPTVSRGTSTGWASGVGAGLGYCGTVIALLVCFQLLNAFGWESKAGVQSIFIATAVLFMSLSLFLFLGVKETPKPRHAFIGREVMQGLHFIWRNLRVRRFLLGMFFYTNGVTAVIIFLFLFAQEVLGLTPRDFFFFFGFFALWSVIGSLTAGRFTAIHGGIRVLVWTGLLWIITVILLMVSPTLFAFGVAGITGGAALGSVWTASRPQLLELVPKKRVGSFFGFLELTGKMSGVLGPVIFGWLASFASYNWALLSLLVFFVIGIAFIKGV